MSFREIYRDQRQKLPVALSTDACKGHTYIVTGANGGLGYECTKHLVSLGAARVIMAVRNIDSGEEARKTVELETGRPGVLQVWQLDLAAFDSVAKFARRVAAQLDRVDGVVQNAAVAMSRWIVCEKPNEMNMTVNVLSQLLLVVLLMPHLKEVGQRSGIVPRITLIGSNVAFTPDAKACMERLDGSDIFGDVAKEEKWSASTVAFYPFSKLLLFWAVREIAASNPVSSSGVIINYTNPGLCSTNLDRNAKLGMWLQINIGRLLMGRTAKMGSRTLLHGIAAEEATHGKYLSECETKEHYVPDWAQDERAKTLSRETWNGILERLEKTQPGCTEGVVGR